MFKRRESSKKCRKQDISRFSTNGGKLLRIKEENRSSPTSEGAFLKVLLGFLVIKVENDKYSCKPCLVPILNKCKNGVLPLERALENKSREKAI